MNNMTLPIITSEHSDIKLEQIGNQVKVQDKSIKFLFGLMSGIIVVMFLALLGFIFTYIQFVTTATNDSLQQTIILNSKLDSLIQLQTTQLNQKHRR